MSQGQAWVELVGDLIVARVRGEPNEQLLRETQDKVLFLVKDAGRARVLYDTLEMDATANSRRIRSMSKQAWIDIL